MCEMQRQKICVDKNNNNKHETGGENARISAHERDEHTIFVPRFARSC